MDLLSWFVEYGLYHVHFQMQDRSYIAADEPFDPINNMFLGGTINFVWIS
jgi:hypothetical protein